MKKVVTLLVLIFSFPVFSQQITFSDKFEEKDYAEAFDMLGIKVFKYQMPEAFKGHYIDLIIREYYDGIEVKSDDYAKRYENKKNILLWQPTANSFTIKIQTLRNDTVETFNTRLPGMGIKNYGLKLKLKRSEYLWEALFSESKKIELDKEIPLLTFATNPENADRPDLAVYCELPNHSYKDWYEKLKVKHYFVILTKVTKP